MGKSLVPYKAFTPAKSTVETAGTGIFVAGAGSLAVYALAAILPGGFFFWALLLLVTGFIVGK